MLVPSMLNMADVMADSGFTEEEVFDCGISGQIIFLVVVPLIGACRVPVEALSHFMAGADDYAAEGMPEHWSEALSGKWTIKRDRLRILPRSWEAFSDSLYKLAESLDAASEPKEADAPAAKGEALPVVSPSIEAWRANARQIGEKIHKEKPSLNMEKIAEKTHKEMTTRKANGDPGMTGRGDNVPLAGTIKRHALTGIKS